MKLGAVIKKERKRKGLSIQEVADFLGITEEELVDIESGNSLAEEWGPKLAQIAIKLETPTSRLISSNGKSDQAGKDEGQCGMLIKAKRRAKGLSQQELAKLLGISFEEITSIENGSCPLELYAPLLLKFAECIKQPIFNLFYPCGVSFQELKDY
jgi:transcriptional regulator with XRE-family HTH domain